VTVNKKKIKCSADTSGVSDYGKLEVAYGTTEHNWGDRDIFQGGYINLGYWDDALFSNYSQIIWTSKIICVIVVSMKDVDILALTTRIETVLPTLNEYQRRRYLSAEAKAIGYGGISLVSRVSEVQADIN
jgi:hypothetical protein